VIKAVLRPQANDDLSERILHYRRAGGDELALRFVGAAESSLRRIERSPGIGSTRIGELSEVPGLRSWPVKGFPARWYYFIADDRLDVVRLLSDAQDLLAILDLE
jgi:toxin ParE1/3/4